MNGWIFVWNLRGPTTGNEQMNRPLSPMPPKMTRQLKAYECSHTVPEKRKRFVQMREDALSDRINERWQAREERLHQFRTTSR
jgi:hypothetical protein